MVKERILVVDDEEDILELVRYNLTREGYHVHCSKTGEDTLDMARTDHPDLIVLDLMLPGIDGLEVTKTLKSRDLTKDIPASGCVSSQSLLFTNRSSKKKKKNI
jgi:two-component system phosphate regulon response regulator PhoB